MDSIGLDRLNPSLISRFWERKMNNYNLGIVLVAILLGMALSGTFPSEAAPLQEVMDQLKSEDPADQIQAALELGEKGEMSHSRALSVLLKDSDPDVREAANHSLWRIWMRSGEPEIDNLMSQGVVLMELGQLKAAIAVFTKIIRRKPNFAEGWNKRATALYMAKRYSKSVADCKKTLELNPYHFGALSGLGLNYVELDNLVGALNAFRRTLEVLPYSKSTARKIEIIEQILWERQKKI